MQQELLFIRHTSVEHPRGFCYGNLDVDVSIDFESEASWLQNQLTEYVPDQVFCSPLQRCVKLASYLFQNHQTDDRLKELNYGTWEGLTWEEIGVPEGSNWIFHHPSTILENGESFEGQKQRVQTFIDEIATSSSRRIAIVAHGGVIRSAISHFLNIPLSNTKNMKVHYAAQVKFIKENDRWRMSFLNPGV